MIKKHVNVIFKNQNKFLETRKIPLKRFININITFNKDRNKRRIFGKRFAINVFSQCVYLIEGERTVG